MSSSFYLQFFLAVLLGQPIGQAYAYEVIVEASSIDEEKIEPSRSTSIITENEIRVKKDNTVADLLREIPGVEVVRQGGVGQITSIYIRGARSEDTLVLIDGIEANDVMSPAAGFDFSSLSSANVSRIEVYRGPQSVRFGAGALGGVINIVTKEGVGRALTNYSVEGGTYQTNRASLVNSARVGDLGYSLGFDRFYTEGFSAAAKSAGNTEVDGAEVRTASTKISWLPNATSKLEGTFRYANATADLDGFGGMGGDDPNNTGRAKQRLTGVSGSNRFFNNQLKSTLGFYYSEVDRSSRNLPDAVNVMDSSDKFLSENKKIQYDNELTLGEHHTLRVGLQWREESGLSNSNLNGVDTSNARREQTVAGESLTYLFESETWFFDLGVRDDQCSVVGSISSHRTSVGRKLPASNTKAFVSYGTGFKLPSLYQLYSTYGDKSLRQEESSAVEGTIEQKIGESTYGALFGTFTYFENRYNDLIDYNLATNKYFNISKAVSKGFEVQSTIQFVTSFSLGASYTYLAAEDKSTGLALLRRPKNALALSGRYMANGYELLAQFRYKGDRSDVDPATFQRIMNNSYETLSVGLSYGFSKLINVNARIENVFNKKYEEVVGYGTAGTMYYVGLSGEI